MFKVIPGLFLGTCLLTAPLWSSCGPSLKIDTVHSINVGYKEGHEPLPDQDCTSSLVLPDSKTTIFAGSVTQPTIAVNPKCPNYIVAAWGQAISNPDIPATNAIGIAYSKNGGKTWHHSHVIAPFCNEGASYQAADPSLSYSPNGKRLYLAIAFANIQTQPNTDIQQGINLYTSDDNGITWSGPTLIVSGIGSFEQPNGNYAVSFLPQVSANSNNCRYAYTTWLSIIPPKTENSKALISLTGNAGRTWSAPFTLYDPDLDSKILSNDNPKDRGLLSVSLVVLPKKHFNGDLLGIVARFYARPNQTLKNSFPIIDIAAVRSNDGGFTWNKIAKVIAPIESTTEITTGYKYNSQGEIIGLIGKFINSSPLLAAGIKTAVNSKNGHVYVVWQAGDPNQQGVSRILLSSSQDGGLTWSTPITVSRTPLSGPNPQAFSPSVAVAENGDIAVLYCDFRNTPNKDPNKTYVDNWVAIYKEDGARIKFQNEIRLSKKSYLAQNAPIINGVITLTTRSSIVAHNANFYGICVKTLEGPFSPAVPIFKNTKEKSLLLLDKNQRSAPFVSIIRAPYADLKLRGR